MSDEEKDKDTKDRRDKDKDEDDKGDEGRSDGSSSASQDTSRKGSVDESKPFDPSSLNLLFLGPFGKCSKLHLIFVPGF